MGVVDRTVARLLPVVPRRVVQRLSSPYIAGPTLDDARRVAATLNTEGKLATIDVLGEEITRAEEAERIASQYREVLAAVAADRLGANLSVKLTALGLKLDRDLCRSLLAGLVEEARLRGTFVRVDMEDSSCTDDTLALYRELRALGHENVGIVLQSCLKRTLCDVADLRELRPNVRLCKGVYLEPRELAFRGDDVIRRSFLHCLEALLDGGGPVAVATHDEWLLQRALETVDGAGASDVELQMLLGVRETRATELVAAGRRVRVYVPFGQRWYEYSVRRLQENPRMAGIVAKATAGRLVGRG